MGLVVRLTALPGLRKSIMRRTFVSGIADFGAAAGRLGLKQSEFLPQRGHRFTEFEHRLVLFDDMPLQVRITLLETRQSFRIAHARIAKEQAAGRQVNL